MLKDFPKLYCPFIRKDYKVKFDSYMQYGKQYQLRTPNVRLAIDKINPGYEWVFDDPNTFAVEKLDGSNISLEIKERRIYRIQNRMNEIDPLNIDGKNFQIIEGIFRSIQKGYINEDGVYYGEVIGPSVQTNPLNLPYCIFYPFSKSESSLRYKSFHNHDRTFSNWSSWFEYHLTSLYAMRYHNDNTFYSEGVIFYNNERRLKGEVYMAKLRRNMFRWYYPLLELEDEIHS